MFVGGPRVRTPRVPLAARFPTIPTTPPLPSWVPAPGGSATYESGGAVLTNTWRSTHITEDEFYSSKMRNAYSGTFLHPTWRDKGGLVFIGGGHANTNYNGVHIATFGQDTIYYERVCDPTDWTAGDTGDIEPEMNSYGEKSGSSPLRIGQGHSYGLPVVIDGDLWHCIRTAVKYTGGGDLEYQTAHRLPLTDPGTASSARAWVRETNSTGAWSTASPGFCAYAASQDRIYYMDRAVANVRWFDRATDSWVVGDNSGWGYGSADSDGGDPVTGTLFAVPERNLIVAAYRQSGNLVIQYLQTTESQPTVSSATLGTSLALPVDGGKAVCWCSDSSRILVFGVTSNTDRVYEITIPATLSNTWSVDNHVISGPSIDPVAIMSRSGWGCQYHSGIRAVVFGHVLKHASSSPDTIDRITVYRPRST